MRQLHGALTRVIAHASLTARPLSSELIAEVIPKASRAPEATPVEEIQQRVARAFGISRAELVGSTRAATPLRARQVAIYLTRELTDLSLPQIGRLYGGRDHSTVLNSLRRIEARLRRGPKARRAGRGAARRNPHSSHRRRADRRRRCKNQCFATDLSTARKARRRAESAAASRFSTSPNPTQEGIDHLKLTTKREELVAKLSIVSRAVSTRAATQSLSGILLAAGEAGVSLCATDLEMGLKTKLDAEVDGEGSVLLPGRLLAELARSLGDADGGDRAARGRARRRDPQRQLELPPPHPAQRGLPKLSRRRRAIR